MRGSGSKLFGMVVAAAVLTGAGALASAPSSALADEGAHVCSGTPSHPGTLSGSYTTVVVKGVCYVNAGPAFVHDGLTVSAGGALVAAFGSAGSSLTLYSSLRVEDGGTAILGCYPSEFPCYDDPNPKHPTLTSHSYVHDDLIGDEPLGILVHNSTIGGDVRQTGGGGGFNCTPQGIFASLVRQPVYSAYEDSTIHDIVVSGVSSCWLGITRVYVGDDVRVIDNQLADPDAIEVLSNYVHDDLACRGNSMVWDGADQPPLFKLYPRTELPNKVSGDRSGQCVRSTPTTRGGPYGPPGSF